MAKREYVNKNIVINKLWGTGLTYKHLKIMEELPTTTEREIIEPYLSKLKAKMKERDEDNGGEPYNAVDRGYHLACEHLYAEIDDLLSEQGDTE